VEETTNSGTEPQVGHVLDGDTARITVTGELTEAARRPLVRVLTDLLLQEHSLSRVLLDLRRVPFMNSAGMGVLVQVQRMAAPRAIEVALLDPPENVRRPLQLSGLWRRFPVVTSSGGHGGVATEPGEHSS
jgi:stage II sporulation protein AA (anti-sigma F factor antagonist)